MTTSRRTLLLSGACLATGFRPAAAAHPAPVEEFIGPLVAWANVKQVFGATGDGRTDDTAALQKALDAHRDPQGTTSAVYLPAGTYRITRTLTLPRKAGREAMGLNIQGEDPARTVIRWDGPADGVMFDHGARYTKLGHITFDGARKAKTAIRFPCS